MITRQSTEKIIALEKQLLPSPLHFEVGIFGKNWLHTNGWI
jgi:hypothetical protein